VLSNVRQARPVHLGPLRIRLKKVVPDVGTRNVNVRPDIVQDVVLREIPASDLFVVAPELPEHSLRIDSGQRHDQEKTTEPDHESETGTSEKCPV